jgi:hypothetical protein
MRLRLALVACFCLSLCAHAATGRVLKVLPHFLDLQGRHATSPSLFDRDAYQAYLRLHPDQRSAVRFDVEWKTKGPPDSPLKIRAELRGVARGNLPSELTIENAVVPGGWFSHWTSLTLRGEDYTKLGEITAWRVTLWEGTRLLGEQKSFLW